LTRSRTNLRCVENWMASQSWVTFLARDPHTRSSTSICLVPTDAEFQSLTVSQQWARIARVCARLADEQVAYDIKGHKAAGVPCFRIWGGPTVEASDIESLLPWLAKVYCESVEGM
jgi:phosphoserine aminotransferase